MKPAILKTKEQLEKKYELLGMLSDIEVAAQMLEKEKAAVDPLMGMRSRSQHIDYILICAAYKRTQFKQT